MRTLQYQTLFLLITIHLSLITHISIANDAIDRAMESVRAAVLKAEADPNRPVYHFRPTANWMNDPNGTIYYEGYYHVFYQHNPYGDQWGHMHWGHTRSKDLVHWEHMPIALWPSIDQGEDHCFSGCARINDQDQLILYYTSVDHGDNARPNEQWAAIDDGDTVTWKKYSDNPLLDSNDHDGQTFGNGWRDPFIFDSDGRTFMVLGADTETEAVIPIYEATDESLLNWDYKGDLFTLPKDEMPFFECPNFFEVDGKWMLICSPYRPLVYWIGDFDIETLKFKPEKEGILDRGYGGTANFYASNIAYAPTGECLMFGWIRGFENDLGWNGCLALPRLLSIGDDGLPRQIPIPELAKLRGDEIAVSPITISDEERVIPEIKGHTVELSVEFDPGDAGSFGIKVRCDEDGGGIAIGYAGGTLTVAGTEVPFPLTDGEALKLQIFLDRSVMEVFVNDGREAVTRTIKADMNDVGVSVFSEGGSVIVESLKAWEVKAVF